MTYLFLNFFTSLNFLTFIIFLYTPRMNIRPLPLALSLTFALSFAACSSQGEARTPLQATTASSAKTLQANAEARATKRASSISSIASTFSSSSRSILPPRDDLPIPILVYHHIRKQEGWSKSTWSWKMTVTPETFEKQMKWLKDHNYESIDLDTYVAIRKKELRGPEKPVVITFDDNNLNAYENGVPVMGKYGFTATFYQITNHLKNPNMIDENRTKDLINRGFDIQSHTVSHTVLPTVSSDRLKNELSDSKKILEELTGKPIRHLCYPGTAHNQKVRDAAKAAGYITGTIMDPRISTAKDDLMKLPRIMMTDDTNLQNYLP
jgi:peptidoglycan/xylan/chitin deacetylase (PgdA/CDA1 family)